MSFFWLIIKNPFRNKTRTLLAIIGIAIGITVIVALGMVTGGLKSSTESSLKAGAAEITVMPIGSSSFTSSGSMDINRVTEILSIKGVKDTAGIIRITATLENSSNMNFGPGGGLSLTGIESNKLNLVGIETVNGTLFNNESRNEVIIGKTAAGNLNKTVGDTINFFGSDYKIVGIFETGNFILDAGAYTSLSNIQNITNNTNQVSSILVKVDENANVEEVSQNIELAYPNELSTTTAADQQKRINQGLSTIDTATWAISLLAIIIGGVGVINTMIMSVYERTREIGVLKAVGWKNRRILTMILGESVVLTIIAAIIGTLVGIVGVEILLSASSSIGGVIEPSYSLDIFLRAFGVAFLVGIVGGLYPAYRASRLAPTEALRYE